MKYNTIEILKTIESAIKDPTILTDKLGITQIFEFLTNHDSNNDIYVKQEDNNKENKKSIPIVDNKAYNDNTAHYRESNIYTNKKECISSNQQGVIDSIAQELTPVRLQQAIILSEIVGKPRSKTRRKRRL